MRIVGVIEHKPLLVVAILLLMAAWALPVRAAPPPGAVPPARPAAVPTPAPVPEGGVAAPVPRDTPAPRWPDGSQRPGHDVVVPVLLLVDEAGLVRQATVETGISPEIDEAAIAAVRTWRFAPARSGGTPVAARIRVFVRFPGGRPGDEVPRPRSAADGSITPPGSAMPDRAAEHVEDLADQVVDVTIRGQRPRGTSAASDFDLRVGQLGSVPRRRADQLLTLAPGILLTNHGGEGHAANIFLRGFDGAEGQDLAISVDHVPVNEPSHAHGHGYADQNFIIPELVDSLRVVEGPFDPRQGDFAVAGSAEYRLGLTPRGVMAQVGTGSHGEERLLLLWGPSGRSSRTFAGLDMRQGDGFGPNRAHEAVRMQAAMDTGGPGGSRVDVSASAYATRFDSAGVVRVDDYEAGRMPCSPDRDSQFYCTYDEHQGGAARRFEVAARVTGGPAASSATEHIVFAILRESRIRENFTGFVGDQSASGDGQRGDAIEQATQGVTVGAAGWWERRSALGGRSQRAEVGYQLRHDDGTSVQRRLRDADGIPYRVDFDEDLGITNVAGYLSARVQPLARLVLSGGLRLDTYAFAVVDRNLPEEDRSGEREPSQAADAFGFAVQPRLSAQLALRPGLHLTAAAGIGSRSSEAAALSDGEFAPFARVTAAEAGLKSVLPALGGSLDARAIAYYTRVERDLLFDETRGRNVLQGPSNRFGALVVGELRTGVGLEALGSFTWAEAHLPPGGARWWDVTAGPRMPYIPRFVTRLDASYRSPIALAGLRAVGNVSLGVTHVGPRPLPLEQLSPSILSTDAATRVRWRQYEIGIEVTNLLDRRDQVAVFNYTSNFRGPDAPPSLLVQQHFSAGAPRALWATFTILLGGSDDAG